MKIDGQRINTLIDTMKIERECVQRACDCDRNCSACDLVQDDEFLLGVFNDVIILLEMIQTIESGINAPPDNIPQECV